MTLKGQTSLGIVMVEEFGYSWPHGACACRLQTEHTAVAVMLTRQSRAERKWRKVPPPFDTVPHTVCALPYPPREQGQHIDWQGSSPPLKFVAGQCEHGDVFLEV